MNICELVHPYEITIKTEEMELLEDWDKRYWKKSSSYHQQQSASPQNALQTGPPPSTTTTVNPSDTSLSQPPPPPTQPGGPFQTVLRLHDEPGASQSQPKPSRKRKTPPTAQEQQQPPPPPPPVMHPPPPGPPGVMPPPPPHSLMHPPHMGPPPPLPYQYIPQDYSPGGLTHPPPPPPQGPGGPPQEPNNGRSLSQSKRAEQNRKAQRAFRERRDQHVKALESRSQLLDAALASADEANRRWEECRQLLDQLRMENAALRAALAQAQMINPNAGMPPEQQQQQQQPPPPPPRPNDQPAVPPSTEREGADGSGAAKPSA